MTAEAYYSVTQRGRADLAWYVSPRGPLGKKAARFGLRLPPFTEIADAPAAIAHMNRDRWVVACPDCVRDFQLAWDGGAPFMCSACWNESIGGLWREVVFPVKRAEIETVIAEVPRESRNWLPGGRVPSRASLTTTREVAGPEYERALRKTSARGTRG